MMSAASCAAVVDTLSKNPTSEDKLLEIIRLDGQARHLEDWECDHLIELEQEAISPLCVEVLALRKLVADLKKQLEQANAVPQTEEQRVAALLDKARRERVELPGRKGWS